MKCNTIIGRILTGTFLILIAAGTAISQSAEQQTAKIRALYAAANKRVADGLKDKTSGFHHALWTVGGKDDGQQWAGVGTMAKQDEIWFDIDEIWFDINDPGGEDEKAVVRKIISVYQGAADLHSRSEYFYDEAGELIFVFSNGDANAQNKMRERRFYYANEKPLRLVRDGKNIDAGFSAEDLDEAREESENAQKMQKQYAGMVVNN